MEIFAPRRGVDRQFLILFLSISTQNLSSWEKQLTLIPLIYMTARGNIRERVCFFPPDIDLNDPEVQAAAAKIQAGFRGHMTRKEKPPAGNGAPEESPPSKENNATEDEEIAAIDLTDPGGEKYTACNIFFTSFQNQSTVSIRFWYVGSMNCFQVLALVRLF